MIIKNVKYVDLNGDERSEELFFNLSSVEQLRFESRYIGGEIETLEQYLKGLIKEKNARGMLAFLEDLILSSVGIKSEDGRRFIKPKEMVSEFEESIAYAELVEELFTDPNKLEKFTAGVLTKTEKKDLVQIQ